MQVQFYHLLSTPLERALPKLLEKAVAGKYRVLLKVDSEQKVEFFNQHLWTYDPGSFLPHGTIKDAHPELQPVFISTSFDFENHSNLICITDGSIMPQEVSAERILDIFDGRDEAAVVAARKRWNTYKERGDELAYLKQNEKGGWEKKAA